MLDRGKLAVLLMLTVAVAAAGFAWWWNVERTKRSLALYGSEGAWLVRNGQLVEILKLASDKAGELSGDDAADDASLAVGNLRFKVVARYDVSRVKGLIHARAALVDDPSYEWETPPQGVRGDANPWLVRFADERGEIYLAIDPKERRLTVLPAGKSVRLIPKIADGWQSFLDRHAAQTTPPEPIRTAPLE